MLFKINKIYLRNEMKLKLSMKVLQKLTEFEQFAIYNIQVIVIGT